MRKFFFILLITPFMTAQALQVNYTIEIPDPNTHYANVTIHVINNTEKTLSVKMPVWTPGSYMIREFERNVDKVTASNGKESLTIEKTDKNTWQVKDTKGAKNLTISYPVYCFEASVRTSYIDNDRGFFILTSCLMHVNNHTDVKGVLELKYPSVWKNISTTLTKISANKFSFDNYDELVDSPIEIGNHEEISFDVKGVKHRVALVGLNNCPKEKFTADLKKTCETMTGIIASHPCKEYMFFIHHVEEGGGGLEHANSCVVQFARFNYTKADKYVGFLGLCAHEYFHLWNVKRIRPAALGPFDYSKENHTNLLWVAEGITSYYDELALYRAGFWTREQYFEALAGGFAATENRYGAKVMSLHEGSFDAWVKEYRPSENSINSGISYYTKGAIVAALLDIEIIKASNGVKHLDDLMQYLYNEFYVRQNLGFTDAEFYAAINTVAGKPIDMNQWVAQPNDAKSFEKWNNVLAHMECILENKVIDVANYTGINTEIKGEKLIVRSIDAISPGVKAGLQAGDELIAVNNLRIRTSMEDILKNTDIVNPVNLTFSRSGLIKIVQLQCVKNTKANYKIVAKNNDNPLLIKWLIK